MTNLSPLFVYRIEAGPGFLPPNEPLATLKAVGVLGRGLPNSDHLSLWPPSCTFCVLNGAFWTVVWRNTTSEPEPQDCCSPRPLGP